LFSICGRRVDANSLVANSISAQTKNKKIGKETPKVVA
jgi:hypothetical protein